MLADSFTADGNRERTGKSQNQFSAFKNPVCPYNSVSGLTHEGSSVVAGSRLHGPGTVRVAGSERFGNWCAGLSARITCPTQDELQCGSLRKRLKRRQPLWENRTRKRSVVACGHKTHNMLNRTQTHYLSV